MCRLNVKFALGQNVPDSCTNRIVGFILGETCALEGKYNIIVYCFEVVHTCVEKQLLNCV